MPTPFLLGVPVDLVLRDSLTGREVRIPTDQVVMEVQNHYRNNDFFHASEDTLTSRTVTITADFFNMAQQFRQDPPGLPEHREIGPA